MVNDGMTELEPGHRGSITDQGKKSAFHYRCNKKERGFLLKDDMV